MTQKQMNSTKHTVAVVGLLFCGSGIPALIYQVAWQRILCLHSGGGIYSVAIVVAAFMLGLGIGSEAGGAFSARVTCRRALGLFAAIEISTGLFALASCWLYYDLLYYREFWVDAQWWQLMAAQFAALAVPTTLMGMTLPLLVRATVRETSTACWTISCLYSANTLGAAIGAAVTTWMLIGFMGIRGAVSVGAALNFTVGFCAAVLLWRSQDFEQSESEVRSRDPVEPPAPLLRGGSSTNSRSLPLPWWGVLYGLSGFIALGLEIIWFRVLDVAIKSNSLTYGTVLSIFLFGLAVGCWLGGRFATRSRQPLAGFLACQCGLLTYSAAVVILLVYGSTSWPVISVLDGYWGQYEGLGLRSIAEWRMTILMYVALPMALYFVPTVLMGLSFSYLQQAVQDDPRTSGRKVGLLQSANIAGSTVGSLVVGVIGLNLLGAMGSLRILLAGGIVFALLGVRYWGLRSVFGVAAVALGVSVVVLPDASQLWSRLHGAALGSAFVKEDASGVAVIGPSDENGHRILWLNGKGQATLPFGGIHITLGALPAIIHPRPVDIAVIGLGGGGTPYAASCRPETEHVRVFEICSALLELKNELILFNSHARLGELMASRQFEIVAEDGRNAIVHDRRLYDIIEADAIRSDGAYSGNLYSVEFFQSCAAKLKPGGLFCTWTPTLSTRKAFSEVFPHVVSFDGPYLIGSRQPIMIDHESFRERALSPGTRSWLAHHWTNAVLAELETCQPYDRRDIQSTLPNYDLFPRDEFDSTRYVWWRIFARLPFGDRTATSNEP